MYIMCRATYVKPQTTFSLTCKILIIKNHEKTHSNPFTVYCNHTNF